MQDEILDWVLDENREIPVVSTKNDTVASFKQKFVKPKRNLKQRKDVRCTITLDRDLYTYLESKAKREGRSFSALLRLYLWASIEKDESQLNI